MNPLLFYFPVLRGLNNGKIIRLVAAMALRIQAVAAGLAGIWLVIMTLKTGFASYVPASFSFGAVIAAILLLVCFYAIAQVMWFRSNSILELEEGPFKVVPIISINLKCCGEVYATFLVTMGVASCLMAWLTGGSGFGFLNEFVPFLREVGRLADNNFLTGLFLLFTMLAMAFTTILVFYFLAELVVVLVDIALGVRRITPGAATSVPLCRTCNEELEAGSAFCTNCGTRAR